MGTLEAHRRKGLAAVVLKALEKASVQQFGAVCGFLQAREVAIPFYRSQVGKLLMSRIQYQT